MSLVRCHDCGSPVDSDDDPDGFYVPDAPDVFICQRCRERHPEPDWSPPIARMPFDDWVQQQQEERARDAVADLVADGWSEDAAREEVANRMSDGDL